MHKRAGERQTSLFSDRSSLFHFVSQFREGGENFIIVFFPPYLDGKDYPRLAEGDVRCKTVMDNIQNVCSLRSQDACNRGKTSGMIDNGHLKDPYPSARHQTFTDYSVNNGKVNVSAA